MTMLEPYGSPTAAEAAIAAAARHAYAHDSSLSVNQRIRLEYFHRFLSRIFSDADDSDWMLKGGTNMLARVATARSTIDVDLFRRNRSLDVALDDLRRLATIDLGDHFRFDYTGHIDAISGDQQVYAEGYKVNFDIYIGAKKKGGFHVDLVTGVSTTDEPQVADPANALILPRFPSNPYRLYPIVDQAADKVCATLALYRGKPSGREKDLVDLVVIAMTQHMTADKFRTALEVEANARNLTLPDAFILPASWGQAYARLAKPIPACAAHLTIDAAKTLMERFVDPVLSGTTAGKNWSNEQLDWV